MFFVQTLYYDVSIASCRMVRAIRIRDLSPERPRYLREGVKIDSSDADSGNEYDNCSKYIACSLNW
jgi:hypothetical protein